MMMMNLILMILNCEEYWEYQQDKQGVMHRSRTIRYLTISILFMIIFCFISFCYFPSNHFQQDNQVFDINDHDSDQGPSIYYVIQIWETPPPSHITQCMDSPMVYILVVIRLYLFARHIVFLSCNSAVFACRTYIVFLSCLYHYRFLIL